MKNWLFPSCVVLLALTYLARADNEIGFAEKFALASDRESVLELLIPGTEEYYFYHALQYQNARQAAKLAAIMGQWAQRFPASTQRRVIENREAILAYDADPKATLKFLTDRLHLQFNHQQEARDQKPNLPTTLDPAAIGRGVFQNAALGNSDDLQLCTDLELEELVRAKAALRPAQTRALLARVKRPDLPNLLEVIEGDLKARESRGFGEFPIHRELLPEQMDELARRLPALYENQAFVFTRLRKMAPGADVDAEFDSAEEEAWLDRVLAYSSKLPAAFSSLKANLLYLRLQHDRKAGVYDEARFFEYLKLPRRMGYMNPRYLDAPPQQRSAVDLSGNYVEAVSIAHPIGNDEALVRDYFLHLFAALGAKAGESVEILKKWTPYVLESWLKPVLAEAMITNGIGDPERWASLLSPGEFQALKNRVDVDFALTSPQVQAPSDDVSLDLYIKNAPKIIVKVYEINTLSFFLSERRQLNTDLKLEGLVANRETTQDFSADQAGRSPFRRVQRTFKFPELKGARGAWVIEFIGGGKSSRALIRKGQWSLLQRIGPAGEMITVLDEAHEVVKSATVWLDGRKFTPDEKSGAILVPFTQQPGTKPIILADAAGNFATLTRFEHHAEQYRLDAQFHLEREQLLARREATVAVRASLLLGNEAVPPDLLTESKLTITSTTLDGISTSVEVKSPKLETGKEFTHTFLVPDRLASLQTKLTGKVSNLAKGGEKEDVAAERSWAINGIDKLEQTSDGHVSKFGESYFYELLGKNGEPLAEQQIVFTFRHRDFTWELPIALKTNEQGRVSLGELEGIESFRAKAPNGREGSWRLEEFERTWPGAFHGVAGEVIRLPVPPALTELVKRGGTAADALLRQVSLLEERAGTFVADHARKMKIEGPFLRIDGLPAGDYSLRIIGGAFPHEVKIRLTAGKAVGGWLAGANRSLEVRESTPLHIAGVQVEADAVVVQLANWDEFTRVHVAASRFLPSLRLFDLGRFSRAEPGWSSPDRLPNLLAAGREIGDEFRYILERRYSTLFPGNMLSRPGLILNPWEVRSTDLLAQSLATSERAKETAGSKSGAMAAPGAAPALHPEGIAPEAADTNLDFLATSAPVILNLQPDAKGVVRIDRKALGDRQYVEILAVDLQNAVWRTASLPEVPTKFKDLRLTRNLDPQKAFTEKRESTVLAAGQTLTLTDILTSDLETYDSLAGVHGLLSTLSGNANLAQFAWVLQWPKLKEDEKRAKYSEFACHELNVFLARKDPAFFERVVGPYLRNKKDRTFMDDYLLGNALDPYLQPWSFARLNMAERALLAQRMPAEAAGTARHLRELWELAPPNPEQLDHFFDTALQGRSLDLDGALGFATAKKDTEAFVSLHLADAPALAPAAPAPPGPTGGGAGVATRMAARGALALGAESRMLRDKVALAEEAPADRSDRYALDSKKQVAGRAVMFGVEAVRQRELVRPYFRALGPTKEWAENNYYKLPLAQQNAELIGINAFWRDYAAWDGKTPFVSANFTEASRNFAEMMLALAVLDLPFESPKHTTRSEGGQYTLTAAGPVIAFHKEIKPAAAAKDATELLVSQNFYRQGDRYREEGNEKFDKYVTGEFLSGVVYGANVVVTNPTSTPQKLSVLLQIPKGSLPVLGSKATDSKTVRLEPYTTKTFEYFFYFPQPGEKPFAHYPVNVAREEQSAGAAKPVSFLVVRQLSEVDKASWDYVSQYGSDEETFTFLEQNNIERLNLERVAWRARKSAEYFRKLVAVLTKRHVYNEVIYSYAVMHNDPAALREWLRHREDFVQECGPALVSTLLTIDPIERRSYEHLEYSPLVNQRTHRLGAENKIPNPVLRAQYQNLLNALAHRPALEAMDEMSVVYYLFLQDRVEEALARFHTIKAEALPTRLQHDYFRCYAAFYEEALPTARGIANQYADYPVDRWRKLFAEVNVQLDEIEGKAAPARGPEEKPDRELQQGALTATEPSFEFKVENRRIALTWKNLSEVTINYYLMDPEFLFSSSPFVTEDPARFSIIKPTRSAVQALAVGQSAVEVALPPEFAKANVLVEILGAGQRKAQAYHANTLKLALTENYGRLELRDEAASKPVTKAYVKVYARLKNGTIRYLKDGYTDLRGRFDYASLNSSETPHPMPVPKEDGSGGTLSYQMLQPQELGEVEKLAILILSDGHGALVCEANPPSQ